MLNLDLELGAKDVLRVQRARGNTIVGILIGRSELGHPIESDPAL